LTHIRLATSEDFEGITKAELSAGELFRGTHMEWAVGETTDRERLCEALGTDFLWVAAVNGAVAGFLMGGTCDENFHIYEAATHQRYRGQKIGAKLIETALANAASKNIKAATLTTDRTLPWNAPYYYKLGFQLMNHDKLTKQLALILSAERNPSQRCAMLKPL
jgi:GNAT superfamily N-acetyltransferase